MSSENKIQSAIIDPIIDSYIKQLFDIYKEKTSNNKNIVECLVFAISQEKLHFGYIQCIDSKIKNSSTDKVIIILQGLWNLLWKPDVLKTTNISITNNWTLHNYIRQYLKTKINLYYESPLLSALNLDKIIIDENIKNLCKLFKTYDNHIGLSSRIKFLNISLGREVGYSRDGGSFEYCDFSNLDLTDVNMCNGYTVNNSLFKNTRFHGDGSTGTCIHWKAKNCDFTNAVFAGKICNKGSDYTGSDFTNADLSALLYNCNEVNMNNCNFTNAFIRDKDGKKLKGKELLKHLDKDKKITIKDFYYNLPKDGGYKIDSLDDTIWIDI